MTDKTDDHRLWALHEATIEAIKSLARKNERTPAQRRMAIMKVATDALREIRGAGCTDTYHHPGGCLSVDGVRPCASCVASRALTEIERLRDEG